MSIKVRKNKRVKFGLFKNESDAHAECDKREKMMPKQVERGATFHVIKVTRNKEGKRSWLAYCLIPKKGR